MKRNGGFKVLTTDQKARQRWQNTVNNAKGHEFERLISAGCKKYHDCGRAEIEKTPEPFRVTSKRDFGYCEGRFTARAQPDYQGTLIGGRSIVFEAKYTSTDLLKRERLTDKQMESLEMHDQLKALAAVCVGINDKFFFIPWRVWRDMKVLYGKTSVTQDDIREYEVRFDGSAVLFLDYVKEADS